MNSDFISVVTLMSQGIIVLGFSFLLILYLFDKMKNEKIIEEYGKDGLEYRSLFFRVKKEEKRNSFDIIGYLKKYFDHNQRYRQRSSHKAAINILNYYFKTDSIGFIKLFKGDKIDLKAFQKYSYDIYKKTPLAKIVRVMNIF